MNKEIIYSLSKKDFIVTPFKSSGPGGQHRNKTSTAIRIKHPESGAVGECSEHKSQAQNKKIAFHRLVEHPKFKMWHNKKIIEYDIGKSIERQVDELMDNKYIRTEIKNEDGKWIETDEFNH